MGIHVFQVVIEQDEDGVFVAEVPGIQACYAQGDTFEEAMTNIKDVLEMCLEEMKSRGEQVPAQSEIIGVKRLEVAM
jgi:predicted RNase H-like HicB family nuclease